MSELPIPYFDSISSPIEVSTDRGGNLQFLIFIVSAGKRGRFHVLKLDVNTGNVRTIGRELPSRSAKRIVERGA